MTRREWFSLAAAATVRGQSPLDTQGAARDQMYQALEQLSAKAPVKSIRTAISLLRGALDQYPSFGDAYYFRQLCLKRLNENKPQQERDLKAASVYDSEALRERLDPFTLAVPKIYEDLGTVEQKWALVVGASKFDKEKGPSPLQFADADASAFADLLRDPNVGRFPPGQVFLLTSQGLRP